MHRLQFWSVGAPVPQRRCAPFIHTVPSAAQGTLQRLQSDNTLSYDTIARPPFPWSPCFTSRMARMYFHLHVLASVCQGYIPQTETMLPDFLISTFVDAQSSVSSSHNSGVSQEHLVRAMRQYFTPVVSNAEVSEVFDSTPNSGLGSRTVPIYAGNTLGGSSAINGAQFSTPTNEVRLLWCLVAPVVVSVLSIACCSWPLGRCCPSAQIYRGELQHDLCRWV